MSKLVTRKNPDKPHPAKALRRKALALARPGAEESSQLGPEATQNLLHELHLHQLELELQNLALRRAQEELQVSRKRWDDLYDQAPVGYLTLSRFGLILDANLTATMLFGLSRRELHRQPLSHFILPADLDACSFNRTRRCASGAPGACELRLLRKGSTPFWARLQATAFEAGDPNGYRVIISDITERKRLEQRVPDAPGGPAHELRIVLEAILKANSALQETTPASAAWLDSIAAAGGRGRAF